MKSLFKIILGRTIGFIIFLILLGIANLFNFSPLYVDIVQFFINNLLLLFILFVLGMINDIFWLFKYNILAPIVSALLSIFIVTFIYRIFILISGYVDISVDVPLTLVYTAVFIVTLLGGYITIISRIITKEKPKKRPKIEWSDIGSEFKLFFYNMAKDLNRKPKKKKKP